MLQYPGIQPHPLHSRALGLRLRGRTQQAQRGPEVPPAVIAVPRLIGAPSRAAETVAGLRAGSWEHSLGGRRRAALSAGGHRFRLDADMGVGGDREGSAHVGQGAARAAEGNRDGAQGAETGEGETDRG